MPIEHFIDESNEFVLSVLYGAIDDQMLLEHVAAIEKATASIPNFKEVADCTGIDDFDQLTTQGTVQAAQQEAKYPDSKLAIVIRSELLSFGIARVYQTFSVENRRDVQIYKDMDEALHWLAGDDNDFRKMKAFIQFSEESMQHKAAG